MYYPADANVSARAPMAYPATAPWTGNAAMKYTSYVTQASAGTYDFELVNTFDGDCRIWLFEGTIEAPVAVATHAQPIAFTDNAQPLRGHLARTAANDQMRAVWNAQALDAAAQVQWGTQSGVYTAAAVAEPHTYQASDMCGDPAATFGWANPYWWNWALMTDLQPSTVYYYRFGSNSTGAWSAEASFVSPPALGPHQAVNIGALADAGMSEYDGTLDHWAEPSAGLTSQHLSDVVHGGSGYDYSLLLHSGDVSYATGNLAKWALFNSRIESNGLGLRVP